MSNNVITLSFREDGLKHVSKELTTFTDRFGNAAEKAKIVKSALDQQKATLAKLKKGLKGLNKESSTFNTDQVKQKRLIDQTSKSIQQQEQRLNKLNARKRENSHHTRKLQNSANLTFKGYAQLSSANAIKNGLIGALAPARELGKSMSNVRALTGLSKDSQGFKELSNIAKDLGSSTVFTASQVSQAQGYLAMAGQNANEIKQSIGGVISLASAGGDDINLGEVANIQTNIMSGMKLSADSSNRISDVIAQTISSTNTTIRSLGETMKYVAPIASSIGVSLEQASAMAGVLGSSGISGSMAGTSLKSISSRLASPPAEAYKALEKLNIKSTDKFGNMRNLVDLIAEIGAKTKNLGTAEALGYYKAIAGAEAMSSLDVLAKNGNKLQEIIKLNENSLGKAKEIAAVKLDNLDGDIILLGSAFDGLKTSIFQNNEGFRVFVRYITDITSSVTNWVNNNQELATTLIYVLGGIAAVITGLGAFNIGIAILSGSYLYLKSIVMGAWRATMLYCKALKFLGIGLARVTGIAKIFNFVMRMNPLYKVFTILTFVGTALFGLFKLFTMNNSSMSTWMLGLKVGLKVVLWPFLKIIQGISWGLNKIGAISDESYKSVKKFTSLGDDVSDLKDRFVGDGKGKKIIKKNESIGPSAFIGPSAKSSNTSLEEVKNTASNSNIASGVSSITPAINPSMTPAMAPSINSSNSAKKITNKNEIHINVYQNENENSTTLANRIAEEIKLQLSNDNASLSY